LLHTFYTRYHVTFGYVDYGCGYGYTFTTVLLHTHRTTRFGLVTFSPFTRWLVYAPHVCVCGYGLPALRCGYARLVTVTVATFTFAVGYGLVGSLRYVGLYVYHHRCLRLPAVHTARLIWLRFTVYVCCYVYVYVYVYVLRLHVCYTFTFRIYVYVCYFTHTTHTRWLLLRFVATHRTPRLRLRLRLFYGYVYVCYRWLRLRFTFTPVLVVTFTRLPGYGCYVTFTHGYYTFGWFVTFTHTFVTLLPTVLITLLISFTVTHVPVVVVPTRYRSHVILRLRLVTVTLRSRLVRLVCYTCLLRSHTFDSFVGLPHVYYHRTFHTLVTLVRFTLRTLLVALHVCLHTVYVYGWVLPHGCGWLFYTTPFYVAHGYVTHIYYVVRLRSAFYWLVDFTVTFTFYG